MVKFRSEIVRNVPLPATCRGTRAISGFLLGTFFQRLSDAAGTRAKIIDNRVMAKKTKAKAPAKKPSAAKAKKPSASSSGAVVEVEACKS